MDKTDTLKTGVIKLPVTKQPWACINMNCGRLRRWIGHEWMDGVKNEIKNCELLYLSSTENSLFLWRNHFQHIILVCWYKILYWKMADVIQSLGSWRCSRDQSSHILKLDIFQLFPAESFSCPSLLPIVYRCAFRCAWTLPSYGGWCLCCFRRHHSYSQRTRMKKGTNVSVRVTETGGKVGDKLCHMKHYICKAACGITASMPPWHTSRMTFWSQCVCGGGGSSTTHPLVNCENKTLSWLCGEVLR